MNHAPIRSSQASKPLREQVDKPKRQTNQSALLWLDGTLHQSPETTQKALAHAPLFIYFPGTKCVCILLTLLSSVSTMVAPTRGSPTARPAPPRLGAGCSYQTLSSRIGNGGGWRRARVLMLACFVRIAGETERSGVIGKGNYVQQACVHKECLVKVCTHKRVPNQCSLYRGDDQMPGCHGGKQRFLTTAST